VRSGVKRGKHSWWDGGSEEKKRRAREEREKIKKKGGPFENPHHSGATLVDVLFRQTRLSIIPVARQYSNRSRPANLEFCFFRNNFFPEAILHLY